MTLPDFLTQDEYGSIRLTGHRIGLMHVIDGYTDGSSPEQLHEEFPTLSLELINRVLAFYRENRAEVDAYIARCHEEMDRNYANYRPGPGIVQVRQWLELLERADAEHAADPEWSTLSAPEKLQRLGVELKIENRAERG
jgi:uncharacterized protein (DUF433 family)